MAVLSGGSWESWDGKTAEDGRSARPRPAKKTSLSTEVYAKPAIKDKFHEFQLN